MKTMMNLHFSNGEIVATHLWNKIDLNNALRNN